MKKIPFEIYMGVLALLFVIGIHIYNNHKKNHIIKEKEIVTKKEIKIEPKKVIIGEITFLIIKGSDNHDYYVSWIGYGSGLLLHSPDCNYCKTTKK